MLVVVIVAVGNPKSILVAPLLVHTVVLQALSLIVTSHVALFVEILQFPPHIWIHAVASVLHANVAVTDVFVHILSGGS